MAKEEKKAAQARRESRRLAIGRSAAPTAEAMDMAEEFVRGLELDAKAALRMRLLTEEVLELLKGIVDGFSGLFWLESDETECRICNDGTAEVDLKTERDLLSVSSDGKNASVKGFTAKLARFARHYREYMERINALMTLSGSVCSEDYLYIGAIQPDSEATEVLWSMVDYKKFLDEDESAADQIAADRDELQKSILGNLASDVRVGVKDDRISITVVRAL